MQIGAATMKNSIESPQKLKNGTALWPSDSTSGNISKETQNIIWKNICTFIFTEVLFTIAKLWKQVDKKHIYNRVLHSHKKELNFTTCYSMDEPKFKKEKYLWFYSTYEWSDEQNKWINKIETDS